MRAEELTSHTPPGARPTVLFVGDRTAYSDMYLRLVQSEFPQIRVACETGPGRARDRLGDDPDGACAIVMSAGLRTSDIRTLAALVCATPRIQPVLAYQTLPEVRHALDAVEDASLFERLSFLPLRTRIDSAMNILRLLFSGERHVSGEVLDMLIEDIGRGTDPAATPSAGIQRPLTVREAEVLALLSTGTPNKIIAHGLGLSESTVKLHIHHIIRKLGVSNRTEAAVAYLSGGGGHAAGAVQ